MNFKPLLDRVVIKRIQEENRTAGGIIIPDTAKEKPSQGVVVSVGPGGRDERGNLIPMTLKEGDKVLFSKWSGTEVNQRRRFVDYERNRCIRCFRIN